MFKKILVPLDGSPLSEAVLPYVTDIGCRWEAHEVILFRVIPPLPLVSEHRVGADEAEEEIEKMAQEYLDKVAEDLRAKGLTVRTQVKYGRVAEEIIEYAREGGIDLIAMSTHGLSGIQRWVYGSVADRVLRGACRPILLIRPKEIEELDLAHKH